MENGYAIITDVENLSPGNTRHGKTLEQYFEEHQRVLTKDYQMRFGGFAVRKQGKTHYRSGTCNTPVYNIASWLANFLNSQEHILV